MNLFSPRDRPHARANAVFTPNTILLASTLIFASGLMQFASTWMQWQATRNLCGDRDLTSAQQTTFTEKAADPYSWIGDDYPNRLPLDLGPSVAQVLEESRHYALDSPDAAAEYRSMYPGDDLGFVRLGPHHRFFGLVMYHQIHCLDSLREAILHDGPHGAAGGKTKRANALHAQHCLNYLRRGILCAVDTTLEPEVVEGSQDVQQGLGVTRVCRDWGKVYDFVENNYREWQLWKSTNGTSI